MPPKDIMEYIQSLEKRIEYLETKETTRVDHWNVGTGTASANNGDLIVSDDIFAYGGVYSLVDGYSGGGIFAGSSSDVQWYRGAANTWRTFDHIITDNGIDVGGTNPVYGWVKALKGARSLTDGNTGGFTAGASSDVQWYRGGVNLWRTSDSVQVDGDLYTVAWASYGITATGWTTTPSGAIKYKKIGNTVFIQYYLSGTASGTTISFNLPYQPASVAPVFPCRVYDNGSWKTTPALAGASTSSVTVNIYSDWAAASAWVASGTRTIHGSMVYETA